MPHSHTEFAYHIVFATKERRPFLYPELMDRLAKYTGGLIRKRAGTLLAMNGIENHVHILAILSPRFGVSDQMRDVKSVSSGWIHDTLPNLRAFSWQSGYSGFVVPKDRLDRVARYIANQKAHHRRKTFEEELIEMLERAGIKYDPRDLFN